MTPSELRVRREQFKTAHPFPHLVLDGALNEDLLKDLPAAFPEFEDPVWGRFKDRYQRNKVYLDDIELMPPVLAQFLGHLNSPRFLRFLEQLTGIDGLIPDPYLKGGGLHCSGPGGILAPHTDFHFYPQLALYRRLNVLVYLNEAWPDEEGGSLELFADADATQSAVKITPALGRMVVFATDHNSIHGFTQPITNASRYRRSVATYYYTARESSRYSGDVSTYWRQHFDKSQDRRRDRLRLATYKVLLSGSKGLSIAAHRFNPNLTGDRSD